jgi:quercetin dioxygenase-like cupin family protein
MGIASVTPLLPAQTGKNGNVVVAQLGESRFPFSTAEQAHLSPCKVTSEDSAGACSAFELSAMPQAGPALHVHHREDEWYYVLSEKFLFKAGGVEHILPAGSSIWLPRGTPHVWTNLLEVEAKLILVCFPGGFEKFFEEMGLPWLESNQALPVQARKWQTCLPSTAWRCWVRRYSSRCDHSIRMSNVSGTKN